MPPENSSHKASAEERLLASIDLIEASQACALLHIETDDPDAIIQAIACDDAVITLVQNGKTMLPLFQFDTENGLIFGVVHHILMLRPARISNLRLAYWMTRAHVEFGEAPADRFGKDDAAIVAAFQRYIEPDHHG